MTKEQCKCGEIVKGGAHWKDCPMYGNVWTREAILEKITEVDYDAIDGEGGVEVYSRKVSPEKLATFLADLLVKE